VRDNLTLTARSILWTLPIGPILHRPSVKMSFAEGLWRFHNGPFSFPAYEWYEAEAKRHNMVVGLEYYIIRGYL